MAPRVASEDAIDCHGCAADYPVFCDGLIAVLAAGRMIFADRMSEKRRDKPMVWRQSFLVHQNHAAHDSARNPDQIDQQALGLFVHTKNSIHIFDY